MGKVVENYEFVLKRTLMAIGTSINVPLHGKDKPLMETILWDTKTLRLRDQLRAQALAPVPLSFPAPALAPVESEHQVQSSGQQQP
jgi:hypothetical protein